jgi:hypothetical protein
MTRRIHFDGVALTRRIVPPRPRLLSKHGAPTDADALRFELVLDREALALYEREGRIWVRVWGAFDDRGGPFDRLARAVLDAEGERRHWRAPQPPEDQAQC